jgi:hypothetical protein
MFELTYRVGLCCAFRELDGLRYYINCPDKALLDFALHIRADLQMPAAYTNSIEQGGPRRTLDEQCFSGAKPRPYVLFSEAGRSDYFNTARQLRDYIQEHDLGILTEIPAAVNWTQNEVRAWIWTIDYPKFWSWLEATFPEVVGKATKKVADQADYKAVGQPETIRDNDFGAQGTVGLGLVEARRNSTERIWMRTSVQPRPVYRFNSRYYAEVPSDSSGSQNGF